MTDGAPARRFLTGLDDALYTAARKWLVRDLIEIGGSFLLVAEEGQGKSAVAVAVTRAVAAGESFFGKAAQCRRVIYLATEKKQEAARRLRVSLSEDVRHRVMMAAGVDFADRQAIRAFVDELRALAAAERENIALIVVDTAGRAIGADGDENSTRDATRFVEALDLLRRETGAAILLVHHARRAEGRARGSQVLPAWADGVAVIERTKGGRVLKLVKSNIADEGLALPFAIEAMLIDPADEGAGTVAVAVPVRHERRPAQARNLSGDALVAALALCSLTPQGLPIPLEAWRKRCVSDWAKPNATAARVAWHTLLNPEKSRLLRESLICIEGETVRPLAAVRKALASVSEGEALGVSSTPPPKGGEERAANAHDAMAPADATTA